VPGFLPKTSSFQLPYQHHSSSADCARAGLLKLWVATPFRVVKYNFGVAKQIGLTNLI